MAIYPDKYRIFDFRPAMPYPGTDSWNDWGILPFSDERYALVTTYQSGTYVAPDDHFWLHPFVVSGQDDIEYLGEQDLFVYLNFNWNQSLYDLGRGRKYDERWPVFANLREDWAAWAVIDRLSGGDITLRAIHWPGANMPIEWPGLGTVVRSRVTDVHLGDPIITKIRDGVVALAWIETNYAADQTHVRAMTCSHDGFNWSTSPVVTIASVSTSESFSLVGLTKSGEGAVVGYLEQGYDLEWNWYEHTKVTHFDVQANMVGATASVSTTQWSTVAHKILVECGRGRVLFGASDAATYQLFVVDVASGAVGPPFGFEDPDDPARPPGEIYAGTGVQPYWHGEQDYVNILFALKYDGDQLGEWIFAEELKLTGLDLERSGRSVMVPELSDGSPPLGLGFGIDVSARMRGPNYFNPEDNQQLLRRDRVAAGVYGRLYRRDGAMASIDEVRLFAFVIPVRFRRVPTDINGRLRSRRTAFE